MSGSSVPHASASSRVPDRMVAVRLGAMGDVALTTGVLLRWNEALGIRFSVITREAFAPLFDAHPAVREIIPLRNADLRGARQIRLFRKLAEAHAGVPLVDLHGTPRTRLLSLLWKAKVHRYPKYALTRRIFLLSGGRAGRSALLGRNVPQRYASALSPLCPECDGWPARLIRPALFTTPEEDRWSLRALAPLGQREKPVVALHPFATHPSKTWPAGHWRELALMLTRKGLPFFWTGRGDISPFAPQPCAINRRMTSLDFTGRTDPRQLIALLKQADALITGDSGPMHLASGVGTPVIAMFGPTCREWGFFPVGEKDRVLQAPLSCRPCSLHGKTGSACDHGCMTGLTPAMVMEALESILR